MTLATDEKGCEHERTGLPAALAVNSQLAIDISFWGCKYI